MTSPTRFEPLVPAPRGDDRSGHGHRQAIGWLGAFLPVMIVALDRLRPTPGLLPAELTSISAYFYSSGVIVFAGILSALAVYLITYEGYANEDGGRDRLASTAAGWSAVFVVLFPTDPPGGMANPGWWNEATGGIHYGAAALLFGSFIYFCFRLFPKSDVPRKEQDMEKRVRNVLYLVCGGGMTVSLALAVIAGRSGGSIFWQETIALELFALSWLVKGKADRTAARMMMRTGYFAMHPIKAMERMRKASGAEGAGPGVEEPRPQTSRSTTASPDGGSFDRTGEGSPASPGG